MRTALNAFAWEILWKNRLVFVTLGVLLAAGATTAWAASRAVSEQWWLEPARNMTLVAFLASMLLGSAPFLLMESQGGWRMNSMITRWFVLPVRTVFLVLLPLLAGAGLVALLVAVWMPVLNRLKPGLDARYFTAVLVAGLVAVQALAWTVPRRPGQFWVGAALLFPVILILSLGPQDQPDTGRFRQQMLLPLGAGSVLFAAWAAYAAQRNRCGDWPGELPLDRVWQFVRQGGAGTAWQRDFHSRATALLWSDSLPPLRLLTLSWVALVLILFLYFSLTLRGRASDLAFSLRMLRFVVLNLTTALAILWMAGWGLFVGCEPGAGFRTRLRAFRATLPLSSGALAAQRLVTLLLGWGIVWSLPVALGVSNAWFATGVGLVDEVDTLRLARWMAASAQVAVGALPLILWGRFEGFPNVLLAAICSWAAAWMVAANLRVESNPGWHWALVGAVLALKLGGAAWACVRGLLSGHVTWRFPIGLLVGWFVIAAFLVGVMPTWRHDGLYASLTLLVMLPLARLAWCPLAIAANRHR